MLCPFEHRPEGLDGLTLEDHETGELLELPPGGVFEAYLEAFQAHETELEAGAKELGAMLLPVSTDDAFDEVILRALQGGVLSLRSVA